MRDGWEDATKRALREAYGVGKDRANGLLVLV
jgi:hypothetical protein